MYAKEDLSSSKRLVKIRDPIRPEDRELIEKTIRFRKRIPPNEDWRGGQDRSLDKVTDTYGNSFTNFIDWPSDKPMDVQMQAEFFVVMCFKDTVLRMMATRTLTEEEAESIIWMARVGLLESAAETVNHILNRRKEENDA